MELGANGVFVVVDAREKRKELNRHMTRSVFLEDSSITLNSISSVVRRSCSTRKSSRRCLPLLMPCLRDKKFDCAFPRRKWKVYCKVARKASATPLHNNSKTDGTIIFLHQLTRMELFRVPLSVCCHLLYISSGETFPFFKLTRVSFQSTWLENIGRDVDKNWIRCTFCEQRRLLLVTRCQVLCLAEYRLEMVDMRGGDVTHEVSSM